MKEYPETHQNGYISIEQIDPETNLKNADIGIQIAKDGRIWVCINGRAFLRFLPTRIKK